MTSASKNNMRWAMTIITIISVTGVFVGTVKHWHELLQASPAAVPFVLALLGAGEQNWRLLYTAALLYSSEFTNLCLKEGFRRLFPARTTRPNPEGTGPKVDVAWNHREFTGTWKRHNRFDGNDSIPGCSSFHAGKTSGSSGFPSGHSMFAGTMAVFGSLMLYEGSWWDRGDAESTTTWLGKSVPSSSVAVGTGIGMLWAFAGLVAWHRYHYTNCHSAFQVAVGIMLGAGNGYLGYFLQKRYLTSESGFLDDDRLDTGYEEKPKPWVVVGTAAGTAVTVWVLMSFLNYHKSIRTELASSGMEANSMWGTLIASRTR